MFQTSACGRWNIFSTLDKEDFCMKSAKKILALILAGVMALALLTGCGKATSLNRTIAEGMGEYLNYMRSISNNPDPVPVSYQVPELSRNIAPLFDENWVKYDESKKEDVLNEEHKINGKTIEEALKDIMSPYKSATSITFLIADVTDVKTVFTETIKLLDSTLKINVMGKFNVSLSTATNVRVAVVHKTVKGRTYALGVVITEA